MSDGRRLDGDDDPENRGPSSNWLATPARDTSRRPVRRGWRVDDKPAAKPRRDRRPGGGILGGSGTVLGVAAELSKQGHDTEAHTLRQAVRQIDRGREELLTVFDQLTAPTPPAADPDAGIICKKPDCTAFVQHTGRPGRRPVHCPIHARRRT